MNKTELCDVIEVDCNKCVNCDKKNDKCVLYGNDPDFAVKKCAENGFKSYVVKKV